MSTLEKDWKKYPVFHLDLNTRKYEDEDSLTTLLEEAVSRWEQEYGRDELEIGLERRFSGVIRRAHEKTGMRAVILVDEYDKPMLQSSDGHINGRKVHGYMRHVGERTARRVR